MTLQPGSFAASDATGSNETITLQPVSPATSTSASIASAFYGNDASCHPKPATVAADQKSLTITVASGINSLVIMVGFGADQIKNLLTQKTPVPDTSSPH
jgi:hypothetical protein